MAKTKADNVQAEGEQVVPKKEIVEIPKDVLEKLLKGVEELDSLKGKIKDLEGAADINRLTRIQEARNSGKLVKKAGIRVYNDKHVLGWKTLKNDSYFDSSVGRIVEDQIIQLFLDEGEGKDPSMSDPIRQLDFGRITKKDEGEVIKESKDENGSISFSVRLGNGRVFDLPIVFLN